MGLEKLKNVYDPLARADAPGPIAFSGEQDLLPGLIPLSVQYSIAPGDDARGQLQIGRGGLERHDERAASSDIAGSHPINTNDGRSSAHQHHGLNSWKDSSPIIRLSEYLKRCATFGIRLQGQGRCPVLSFRPGLTGLDVTRKTERGHAAYNAVGLFIDASEDLQYLMAEGLIDLPSLSSPLTSRVLPNN